MAASAANLSHPPLHNKLLQGTTIRITSIAASVSVQQAVSLFSMQIGAVRCFYESNDPLGRCLDICFSSRDAAKRALCMDGYVLDGSALSVTLLHPRKEATKSYDQRRNLYVLGLPFELSKSELAGLFEQFGTVSHCVILATVDNASRRRGFVVMSTHDEAKLAMNTLSQTQLKGHTLDISWAVVQRSQGFLDGGDRNIALQTSHSDCSFDASLLVPRPDTPASATPSIAKPSAPPLTISLFPTSLLLVKNLPSFLFSQVSDLQPLFYPFGTIKNIQLLSSTENGRLNSSSLDTLRAAENTPTMTDSISVIVEFASIPSAEDAKLSLHGQVYSDLVVTVNFLNQHRATFLRNDPRPMSGTYQVLQGCFVDPYPYAYAPHHMHRAMFYDSTLERLPYYASPVPYGLALLPPLCAGHPTSPYPALPHALHAPYTQISSWPMLDSRSSSTDSNLTGEPLHSLGDHLSHTMSLTL